MLRIACAVTLGFPHRIIQRENGSKGETFFNDEDYPVYINLNSEWCLHRALESWAYLMPNHIHPIIHIHARRQWL